MTKTSKMAVKTVKEVELGEVGSDEVDIDGTDGKKVEDEVELGSCGQD